MGILLHLRVKDQDVIFIWVPSLVDPIGVRVGQFRGRVESSLCQSSPLTSIVSRARFQPGIRRYGCVIPGAIILCYSDPTILEIDIYYNHPAREEDFFFFLFLFLFFHNFEPFSWHILLQGQGHRWLLDQLFLVHLFFGGPVSGSTYLFLLASILRRLRSF